MKNKPNFEIFNNCKKQNEYAPTAPTTNHKLFNGTKQRHCSMFTVMSNDYAVGVHNMLTELITFFFLCVIFKGL